MLRKTAALCTLLAAIAVCQRDTRPVSTTAVSNREVPLRALITIDDAATMYFWWLKRLPTSLKQLGPSGGRTADANAADLINADLSSGERDGYRFTLSATKAGWIVRAVPLRDTVGDIQTTYSIESRVSPRRSNSPTRCR